MKVFSSFSFFILFVFSAHAAPFFLLDPSCDLAFQKGSRVKIHSNTQRLEIGSLFRFEVDKKLPTVTAQGKKVFFEAGSHFEGLFVGLMEDKTGKLFVFIDENSVVHYVPVESLVVSEAMELARVIEPDFQGIIPTCTASALERAVLQYELDEKINSNYRANKDSGSALFSRLLSHTSQDYRVMHSRVHFDFEVNYITQVNRVKIELSREGIESELSHSPSNLRNHMLTPEGRALLFVRVKTRGPQDKMVKFAVKDSRLGFSHAWILQGVQEFLRPEDVDEGLRNKFAKRLSDLKSSREEKIKRNSRAPLLQVRAEFSRKQNSIAGHSAFALKYITEGIHKNKYLVVDTMSGIYDLWPHEVVVRSLIHALHLYTDDEL